MEKAAAQKPIKREFSAGGVVFRSRDKRWLIIKPEGTARWQLPKGKIDKGETSQQAAIREVSEEGGIKAKLLKKVGTTEYYFVLKRQKIFKKVTFFLMHYLGDKKEGPDWEVDEAVFLPFSRAYERLTFKDDKQILKKARGLL